MNEFVEKLTERDWFSADNKMQAVQIAQDIYLELDNMERKALNPDAYHYHRKRLTILKGKLTKVFNKDVDMWLKTRIREFVEANLYGREREGERRPYD